MSECNICVQEEENCECSIFDRIQSLEDQFVFIQSLLIEIKNSVSEEEFQRKIKTTNTMIQTLVDLDEKVTDNMNRLNEMLKKLKGVVAVALGNLAQ